MPDLNLQINGVEAAARGLTPLLHFHLKVAAQPAETVIQGLMLAAQIQVQCPQRAYSAGEQEKLVELFGPPDQWGHTLRNRLWTHTHTTLGPFAGSAEAILPAACTYDLNIAVTKYFYGLEQGDVSLLFLFSGSMFYRTLEGELQVEPIPWNSEAVYRMPVSLWRELMERHYPGTGWLSLNHDAFERIYKFKRQHGLPHWEAVIDRLLPAEGETGVLPSGAAGTQPTAHERQPTGAPA